MKFDFDKDTPLVIRGIAVGTAVAGFAIFARSVRLFTTFQHASQIPEDFFRKQMVIRGTVALVTENGLLRVQHKPTMTMPFQKYFNRSGAVEGKLTVRLAGVNLIEDSSDWLKKHVLLKPVWLALIKRDGADAIQCDVMLKKGRFFKYSLNRDIVRLGLGRVPGLDDQNHVNSFKHDAAYSRLVHDLLISEQYADRRGVGVWKSKESRLRNMVERFYSYWIYAGNTWRSSVFSRLFHDFLYFLRTLIVFALKVTQIGALKSLKIPGQLRKIYYNFASKNN